MDPFLIFLLADLSGSIGNGIGLLQGIGYLGVTASLLGAGLAVAGERGLLGLKLALVGAVVAGLAFYIAQSAFKAGGSQVTVTQQNMQ
jgi:hypothetical protein